MKSGWILLLILALPAESPHTSPIFQPTVLRLGLVDSQGAGIPIEKAEIIALAWGDWKRLPLSIRKDRVDVVLTADWLRQRWPQRFRDVQKAFLYLRPFDHGPIRSLAFVWPGTSADSEDSPQPVEIRFSFGKAVIVPPGVITTYDQLLEEDVPRRVRLIDEESRPVSGVPFRSYSFWSRFNHCGTPSGRRLLQEGTSDDQGRIPVPAGDLEFLFEFDLAPDLDLNLPHRPGADPPRFYGILQQEDTVVPVKHLREIRPEIRVLKDHKPAAGATLTACLAGCPCGSCCRPVGRVEDDGRVTFSTAFFPARYDRLGIVDSDSGAFLWSIDPRDWRSENRITVELPNR